MANPSRGTSDRSPDKGEVGGSSPPRPTINHQCLCDYSHFCLSLEFPTKPPINDCQLPDRLNAGFAGSACNHCLCVHPPAARDSDRLTGHCTSGTFFSQVDYFRIARRPVSMPIGEITSAKRTSHY